MAYFDTRTFGQTERWWKIPLPTPTSPGELPTTGLLPITMPIPKLTDLPSPGTITAPTDVTKAQTKTYRITCNKCGSTLEVIKSAPLGNILPMVYDGSTWGKKLYCPVCGDYIGYGDSIRIIARKTWPPKKEEIVDITWTPEEKQKVDITDIPADWGPKEKDTTPIEAPPDIIPAPPIPPEVVRVPIPIEEVPAPLLPPEEVVRVPVPPDIVRVPIPPEEVPAPPGVIPTPPPPVVTVPEIKKDTDIICPYCRERVTIKVPFGLHLFWDNFRCPWCGRIIVHAPIGTKLYRVEKPAPGPEAPPVEDEVKWWETLYTKEVVCSKCGSTLRLTLPLELPIPAIAPPIMAPQYCSVCGNYVGSGIKIEIVRAVVYPPTVPEVPVPPEWLISQVPFTPPEWEYPWSDQYADFFTTPYIPGGTYPDIDGYTLPFEPAKIVEEVPPVEVEVPKEIPWLWIALGGAAIYVVAKGKKKPITKKKSSV